MKPEEVPQELIGILDRHAGKEHSKTGSVVAALAEILTTERSKTWAQYCILGAEIADVLNDGETYDVDPLHMAYALLNADIKYGRSQPWAKCMDCGMPFETGKSTNFCSEACENATLAYMHEVTSPDQIVYYYD